MKRDDKIGLLLIGGGLLLWVYGWSRGITSPTISIPGDQAFTGQRDVFVPIENVPITQEEKAVFDTKDTKETNTVLQRIGSEGEVVQALGTKGEYIEERYQVPGDDEWFLRVVKATPEEIEATGLTESYISPQEPIDREALVSSGKISKKESTRSDKWLRNTYGDI